MPSKIKLFVSGQGNFSSKMRISPAMIKVKKILDDSKDGELFTTKQLSSIIGNRYETLLRDAYQMPTYNYKVSHSQLYWGKPATVAQLKKETNQDECHRRRRASSQQ